MEVDDTLEVLPQNGDLYPGVRERLLEAKNEVAQGLIAPTSAARQTRI